jgi:anti-sigma regulatory factor (Ser/Thr protein kinase)
VETQGERDFSASPQEVPHVRHWIVDLAEQASFSLVSGDLAVAVTEATSNAVRHSGSQRVTVRWKSGRDHAEIEVVDDGLFDGRVGSPDGTGGLGIPVMASLVDELSIKQGTEDSPGTRVRMIKRKT